jgi:hypothetical protein
MRGVPGEKNKPQNGKNGICDSLHFRDRYISTQGVANTWYAAVGRLMRMLRMMFIRGSMTAQRYLQGYYNLSKYLTFVKGKHPFLTLHVAWISFRCLEDAHVPILPWPPRSPDLSPMEHVWDIIGRRLSRLEQVPQTLVQGWRTNGT